MSILDLKTKLYDSNSSLHIGLFVGTLNTSKPTTGSVFEHRQIKLLFLDRLNCSVLNSRRLDGLDPIFDNAFKNHNWIHFCEGMWACKNAIDTVLSLHISLFLAHKIAGKIWKFQYFKVYVPQKFIFACYQIHALGHRNSFQTIYIFPKYC